MGHNGIEEALDNIVSKIEKYIDDGTNIIILVIEMYQRKCHLFQYCLLVLLYIKL